MQLQRVADDLPDPLARVQRGVGILKDHLHLTPQRPHPPPREAGDLPTLEADRARSWLQQLQHGAAERRLAAARLADQAQRLAPADGEADVIDRSHLVDLAVDQQPALDREVLDEVGDLEQRLASCRRLQSDSSLDLAQCPLALRLQPAAVAVGGGIGEARRQLRQLLTAPKGVRAARSEGASLRRGEQ